MAAFGTAAGRPLHGRGGSPGFRFTVFAVLAIVAMYLDQRRHYLEQVRYVLEAAAYPMQVAVSSPAAAWRWLTESFQTREALQAENARLRSQQRDLEVRTMRYEALEQENGELRGLRAALPPLVNHWLAAEVISVEPNSLRQRLVINNGASNGVFRGQAVVDETGLIGQTTHVGPWSAEVILITDPEHAMPVQITRTGLRTIAVGSGNTNALAAAVPGGELRRQEGDVLVTSGLGGVFPAGYPVARITEVHRDAIQLLAQVRAVPLAHVDTDQEVMLVWFKLDHPAAPASAAAGADGGVGELKHGDAAMQPQAVTRAAAAAPSSPGPRP